MTSSPRRRPGRGRGEAGAAPAQAKARGPGRGWCSFRQSRAKPSRAPAAARRPLRAPPRLRAMAGLNSLEAVKRKIQALQQQADEAEDRAQGLQRELDGERERREKVRARALAPRPGIPLPGARSFLPFSRGRPLPALPARPRRRLPGSPPLPISPPSRPLAWGLPERGPAPPSPERAAETPFLRGQPGTGEGAPHPDRVWPAERVMGGGARGGCTILEWGRGCGGAPHCHLTPGWRRGPGRGWGGVYRRLDPGAGSESGNIELPLSGVGLADTDSGKGGRRTFSPLTRLPGSC